MESNKVMPVVKLYANLRKLAGTKELSLTGETVRAVIRELVDQHPSIKDVILQGSELRPHIVITVNGHNVTDLNASCK
jgi:molybdopterin converting factor small subunit